MPEAILPKSPLVANIPNAAFPTAGLGLSLDLNGRLPQAILQTLPGYEFAYNEIVANVSVTATTEGTANTVATSSSVTFDGSTSVWVDFSSPEVIKGTTFVKLVLFDGATSLGNLAVQTGDGAVRQGRRLTPSAAARVYTIKAYVDAGTGTVAANAGTSTLAQPGFIRVTKA